MFKIPTDLVSIHWLQEHLNESNLVILDATITRVTDTEDYTTALKIENTRFLDIKNVFSDTESAFPNTLLSPEKFSEAAKGLGIDNNSVIVVYDAIGIYSSARVWWMFKAMGHQNIAVLDGGLPAWIRAGLFVEKLKLYTGEKGNFTATYNPDYFYKYKQIVEAINITEKRIIDARSSERFNGLVSEPREGLRSGHIPNSLNLPFKELQENEKLKSKEELNACFKPLANHQEELIFSCGSGITACILALAATIAGYKNLAVYDGSWTEFGTLYKDLTV